VAHFSMDPTHEQESLPLSHTQNDPILTTKQLHAHQSATSTHNTKPLWGISYLNMLNHVLVNRRIIFLGY
jgi:hypothetical protein